MKQIVTLFFLVSLIAQAGEIQRINSIVNDLQIKDRKNRELHKELNLSEKKIDSLNNQIKILNTKLKSKEDNNQFPSLIMKKKYKDEQSISYFKASSFRINGEVKIYDHINGSAIAVWSDKTSFTSNQRVGKWIKITGFFVNKLWQPAKQELWVKSCDVLRRTQVSK